MKTDVIKIHHYKHIYMDENVFADSENLLRHLCSASGQVLFFYHLRLTLSNVILISIQWQKITNFKHIWMKICFAAVSENLPRQNRKQKILHMI